MKKVNPTKRNNRLKRIRREYKTHLNTFEATIGYMLAVMDNAETDRELNALGYLEY